MKYYNVIWEESHKIVVEAKNKKKAIEKAMEGRFRNADIEITSPAEAYKIKNL